MFIPRPQTRPKPRASRQPGSFRPELEGLEARDAPAVITVDSTADQLFNPTTVTVNTLGPTVSLRDAVNAANNTGGANTVVLQAGASYVVDTVDNFWFGPDAYPAISSNVTIQGNGAVLMRSQNNGEFFNLRFFFVSGGPSLGGLPMGTLTLQNLTLSGGLAAGQGGAGGGGALGGGGGIFNMGTLNLSSVTMALNVARGGDTTEGDPSSPSSLEGGGGFGGPAPGASGGSGSGPTATGGGGGGFSASAAGSNGGGLSGFGSRGGGTFAGVGGDGGGGGSAGSESGAGGNFGSSGFSGGSGGIHGIVGAGGGGGVGGGGGGGIGGGGGGGFGGGGGGYGGNGGFGGGGGAAGDVSSGAGGFGGGAGSSGNSGGAGAGMGGAIFNLYGSVTIIGSLLGSNSALGGSANLFLPNGGGGSGLGGAIFNLDGAVTLLNSIITNGTVTAGTGAPNGAADGSAIYNLSYGATPAGGPVAATLNIATSNLGGNNGGNALANNQVTGTAIINTNGPPILTSTTPPGGAAEVRAFDGATHAVKFDANPFGAFTGVARVAVGDVNGDGIPDYIVGAGPGGGPEIKVYNGANNQVLLDFFAFNPAFSDGVFVASGDVNGDGFADIIVGADAGGGPEVKVFSGKDGSVLKDFFAYDASFTGGVRVAAADVTGVGHAEVIVGAGPGGGPNVKVYDLNVPNPVVQNFFAFNPFFSGGVYVAAGDMNGDGHADIIVGAGAGAGSNVIVFSGADGSVLQNFFAFNPAFAGGVRVGAYNLFGRGAILTGAGPGGGPQVTAYDGLSLAVLDSFFAFDPTFTGGLYVAGA